MIQQGICNSYKLEILSGIHKPQHAYKIALYTAGAELGKGTTAYTATGEVATGGGYAAGGQTLANIKAQMSGDTAVLTFDSPITWQNASFTARGALIYNASSGNKAVAVLDFKQDYTATSGPFIVNLPEPNAIAGLIRIA